MLSMALLLNENNISGSQRTGFKTSA